MLHQSCKLRSLFLLAMIFLSTTFSMVSSKNLPNISNRLSQISRLPPYKTMSTIQSLDKLKIKPNLPFAFSSFTSASDKHGTSFDSVNHLSTSSIYRKKLNSNLNSINNKKKIIRLQTQQRKWFATASSSASASAAASAASSVGKESGNEKKKLHNIVFVLGGPGSGKGTQCAKLVDEFGFIHLSAGDLLRAERSSGSEDGQLIDDYIKQGKIVPVKISLNLLKKAMDQSENSKSKPFLIDGFPRNFDNVQGWEEMMEGLTNIQQVLVIDCPEEVLQERLLSRGETSGRTDDNIETAKKRFKTYIESTMPVLKYYQDQGKLARIPGDLTPDEVYKYTRAKILDFYHDEEYRENRK